MIETHLATIDRGRCAFFAVVNVGFLIYLTYFKKIFSDAYKNREENKFLSLLFFIVGFIYLLVTSIAIDGTHHSWDSSYIIDFLLFKESDDGIVLNYSRAMGYTIIVFGIEFFIAYLFGIAMKKKKTGKT